MTFRAQVIGTSERCQKVVIQYGGNPDEYIFWRVYEKSKDEPCVIVHYRGIAKDIHEAIDAAKAAAIEDPKGYINLK